MEKKKEAQENFQKLEKEKFDITNLVPILISMIAGFVNCAVRSWISMKAAKHFEHSVDFIFEYSMFINITWNCTLTQNS